MKRNFIRDKINLLKFKHYAHRLNAGPKEDCYLRYVIDKYLNETKPDEYIADYEAMIDKSTEKARLIAEAKSLYEKDGIENPKILRLFGVYISMAMILAALKESEVKKYLNLIQDEHTRKIINAFSHPDNWKSIIHSEET